MFFEQIFVKFLQFWQNSDKNIQKPSSKSAKTQFSRNLESVKSVNCAQKKPCVAMHLKGCKRQCNYLVH